MFELHRFPRLVAAHAAYLKINVILSHRRHFVADECLDSMRDFVLFATVPANNDMHPPDQARA
jgi:hypothetical protein